MSETPVAFAGAGRALIETAIAFASDERPFLGHFDPAKVLVVSMGRAAWPAKVLMVSKLPRHRVLCAKKFALHAQNTPKSVFLRLLGELFRGSAAGGAVLGEFFRGSAAGGAVLGEFFRGSAAGGVAWGEFFAEVPLEGVCRASIFAIQQPQVPVGELWCAAALVVGPSTGSVNPSMRSYTHLVQAGSGRPTRPSNRPRNAKR